MVALLYFIEREVNMFPSTFNPITVAENVNLPTVDLSNMTERSNVSYFNETLAFILENQKEFNSANKQFYKSIVESNGDIDIVHESFGDFFGKVKEIIDKLLRFIKSIFEKFVTGLNSFVKREKYLKKHEADFKKFGSIHEFKFTGYEYTFSPEIPVINALAEFNVAFVFNIGDNVTASAIPSGDELKTSVKSINRNLQDGDWYDLFRGKVIASDGKPVYQTDFAQELFSVFRNDTSSPEDFDVISAVVTSTYIRFNSHDHAITDIKRAKESIDSQYNAIKRQVEKMMSINYNGGNRSAVVHNPDNTTTTTKILAGDDISNMDLFIKAKVNQLQEMSNIHAMAFAAKLDALNDCFKQDKALLYRALSKIQGSIGKEV